MIQWTFTGTKDENLDTVMKYIDELRCGELYSHTSNDCSEDCRKRGNDIIQSFTNF